MMRLRIFTVLPIILMFIMLLCQLWFFNKSIQSHKEEIPKYELVQFDNGNYGIRRTVKYSEGGFEYNDFTLFTNNFWWPKNSKHFEDCQVTEQKARDRLEELKRPKQDYSYNLSITEKIIE